MLPGGDFKLFLTRLGYQAMLSLGLIENPATGKARREESQARMVLQDLRMLAHKTEGNLDIDEMEALTNLVRDLERHLGEDE
ncbi:hypothetical protein Pla86_37030 [Planctomycetes bacterium Pla86]|uniref:DUF1844 domain-containing protein n=2 Tax=Engelhardtia mirabilis TaxID=2528011 RepID=A0A518BNP7_9BACT|nr:hypothetical protein Pla133_37050 [Planctomycetes bacterium Pla133]QDV02930.1 hypothetical protein Pla86_37030 [Planctomycetes bacterium Pla86]